MDNLLLKQEWLLTDKKGKFKIKVKITPDHIEMGDEFIFKSKNHAETIKRWRNVIKLLNYAVNFLEKRVKGGDK